MLPEQEVALYTIIILIMVMQSFKLASLLLYPAFQEKQKFFFFSPVLAISTYRRNKRVSLHRIARITSTLVLYSLITLGCIILYKKLDLQGHWKTYSFIPIVYFGCEALSRLFQIAFLPTGKIAANFFNHPLYSKSLTEFWGARWNLWISDWYRDVFVRKLSLRKNVKIPLIYIFTGLWHDLVFTVPHYIVTGNNYIGRMTLYFILQTVFIFGDRALFKKNNIWRSLYFYIAIIAPVPIMVPYQMLEAIKFKFVV